MELTTAREQEVVDKVNECPEQAVDTYNDVPENNIGQSHERGGCSRWEGFLPPSTKKEEPAEIGISSELSHEEIGEQFNRVCPPKKARKENSLNISAPTAPVPMSKWSKYI